MSVESGRGLVYKRSYAGDGLGCDSDAADRMVPPWSLVLLAASAVALQCPDGTTCGEETLCCELPGGKGYGCCPENEVVSRSLPMITSGVSCSNDKGCPDEYSCVGTPQGESACCPFTQGTSCQDGHHCCPSGSHCSEDGHHCVPASNLSAIICPDGKSECPSDATCCQISDRTWGCCPMPQATCCNDHLHCCPHTSVCDLAHGRCVSENGDVPLLKKVPARVKLIRAEIVQEVNCLDGSSCPDGTTCCQTEDKRYGCCPFLSAVCCSDFVHCCPSGTTCDLPRKKCVNAIFEIPMYSKIPALREEATVKCDDTSSCPGTATCCRLASGEWGCCPYEKAVCCGDHEHCCPNGFTCIQGQCQQQAQSIPWSKKISAIKETATVKCDDTSSCPGTATCCRLASGEWGCCPYEKAVCCDDHQHCCPNGFTCVQGQCQLGMLSITWSEKMPAIKEEATVKCDDTSSCPGTATCCRLASGEWGCCPYEKAVCCDDHEHCCPNGFTCVQGQCQQEALSIPWSDKIPAMKGKSTDVKCDDETACPDETTCCRLESGEWGCCPYEQATCCPSGLTCHEQATCVLGQVSSPWPGKINAHAPEVKCDKSHSCAQGTTCCHTEGGGWACCPLEEAVCCSDHLHCCPSGYTCDVATASCNKPSDSLKKATPIQPLDYVWCDAGHYCSDGQTCCRGLYGDWACCPYISGVCCPDRVHCCPYGHVCLNYGAQCSRSEGLRWDLVWKEQKSRL
ncbi:progranulin isoform X1 [Phyllobates terribilis]|uniref:progranulin isoform X1 n=1 Tax=Phyllobates terribilis TaxID=111132 RepID=UPI003CCAD8AD